jgi:hypothetical protein
MTRPARALIGVATGAILLATLTPDFSSTEPPWSVCIICGDHGVADAIANVLLFLPLGVALAVAGVPALRTSLLGMLLSAIVELVQLALPGRVSSPGDVLFNGLGGLAGWLLTRLGPRLARFDARRSARWAVVAACGAAGVVALTGYLLAPSLPSAIYYGQWTPNLGHLAWYRGRVRSARIGDLPVRSARVAESARLRSLLRSGAPIVVEAIAGPPVPRLASLFSIYDEHQREIVLLGPDRDGALAYRERTHAEDYRLRRPTTVFPGALEGIIPGDTLLVTAARLPDVPVCLTINAREHCAARFSAGAGWTTLHPVAHASAWLERLLDALWIASLAFPVGFLSRKRWETGVAALVLGVGLLGVAPATGLRPAGPLLLIAAVAGALAGAWLSRRLSSRAPLGTLRTRRRR